MNFEQYDQHAEKLYRNRKATHKLKWVEYAKECNTFDNLIQEGRDLELDPLQVWASVRI